MCPCMIIDNPEVLRSVVRKSGAHPTHPGAETVIGEIAPFLDGYAQEIHGLWDPVWGKEYGGGRNLRGLDREIGEKIAADV